MSTLFDALVTVNSIVAGAILFCRIYLDVLLWNTRLGPPEKALDEICRAGTWIVLAVAAAISIPGVR